ncbi:DJ-1/PfpI family protein [Aspergillus stella-maris]|uniref:DJ-1/PfpI family protein n=1 Tax=Aspergillus stella-maris TaxID=1810926 RepID=UPI003CCD583B
MSSNTEPLRIGLLLFPGFQSLDAFGPIDCLNVLSNDHPLTLSILSHSLDPVSTRPPQLPHRLGQSVMPTHTFANAPELDVLLVPGGHGTRLADSVEIKEAIKFIETIYPSLKYLITVCTGSRLASLAGVLDGRKATTNKAVFHEAKSWVGEDGKKGSSVSWVAKARWVVDGNVWTSSGVSAGIDVILAWMGAVYGEGVAKEITEVIEYSRHEEAGDDPFAQLYKLV